MKIARRSALIAIVPLALAVAAGFAALANQGESVGDSRTMQHAATGALALLGRAPTASDRLPAAVLASPAARQFGNTSAARLAATIGNRSYFVVPGSDGSVCLIFSEGSGATATNGGTCADRALLRTGAVYLSEPLPDGTTTVAGIVSDGVRRASAGSAMATVRNNVFVIQGAAASRITLDGPSVSLTVDTGLSAPTATVTAP